MLDDLSIDPSGRYASFRQERSTGIEHCSPGYAARLFDAQAAGATEDQLRAITAEGLGETYFRDGGRRAQGLLVEFTDVEQLDFDL
ncbi:hypothetical protein [Streptomyces bungoensis]|uniref:hypothetical protein n=1 Tax=Streptomyces bungoensis TaxID=285568 RepID=UPI003F4D1506